MTRLVKVLLVGALLYMAAMMCLAHMTGDDKRPAYSGYGH